MERRLSVFSALFLVVVLYIYLHNPIFVPLNGMGAIKLLYVLPGFFFLLQNRLYFSFFKDFRKETWCFILIFFYLSFRTIVQSGEFVTAYTKIVMIIEDLFLPFAIICLMKDWRVDFNQFVKCMLAVGAIGAVVSCACFLSPLINSFVRTSIIIIQEGSYLDNNTFRGFGVSEGLTYSYGIIQGVIFSLGLFYIKDNKWFIIFMPFVVVSIVINARTGFVVAVWGLLLFVLQRKGFYSIIVGLTFVLAVMFILPIFMNVADTASVRWINDFFNEFKYLYSDKSIENSGTMNALFNTMIVWPDNIAQWIWGRGYSIFINSKVGTSDVGWILQLNLGGLTYMCILTILFVSLFMRMKKCGMDNWQLLFLLGTLLISNTKGDVVSNSGIIRLLFLFMFFYVYDCKNVKTVIQTGG